MKQSTKTKLFYICTFGIGYFYAKNMAKKISQNKNEIITSSKADKFDVNQLIEFLGGNENIINIQSTLSNLKVDVKNPYCIQPDKIKSMGAKGSFINENKITILFGDHSGDIASKLKNKLGNEK